MGNGEWGMGNGEWGMGNGEAVVPATAGTQHFRLRLPTKHWAPAFAGATAVFCLLSSVL